MVQYKWVCLDNESPRVLHHTIHKSALEWAKDLSVNAQPEEKMKGDILVVLS